MVELTKNNIKYLMMENNKSMLDIADALNISLSTAYAKVREEQEFKLDEIRQLGRLFNVDFVVKKEGN